MGFCKVHSQRCMRRIKVRSVQMLLPRLGLLYSMLASTIYRPPADALNDYATCPKYVPSTTIQCMLTSEGTSEAAAHCDSIHLDFNMITINDIPRMAFKTSRYQQCCTCQPWTQWINEWEEVRCNSLSFQKESLATTCCTTIHLSSLPYPFILRV